MRSSDFQIHSTDKLDRILVKLCDAVLKGQNMDEPYGMVGAAVLDTDNRLVMGLNTPDKNGKRIHAERVAYDNYVELYGTPPGGSIIITTLSPCSGAIDQHDGVSCTDFINGTKIRKVYCGWKDPTQDDSDAYHRKQFHLAASRNSKIAQLCERFARTFLDK